MTGLLTRLGRRAFGPREVALRPARPADAEALAHLHGQSFRIGWDAAEFERLLANRLSRALVGTNGPCGAPVGFILLSGVSPEIEILSVAVEPGRRGEGIARRLVEAAFGTLAAEGFQIVFLEVEEGNAPALRLYARTGFREIGRRAGYYRGAAGEPVAALTMRRDIA
ncbi:GNAT family N-acetyltransferase [Starkeya sp. 3C]|uniref:GNAT family N-acetyltransferase n=1 Tax=Ancylobacter moscoviensis TaxID=2597768 RepID=A0ABY3DVL0_9HYPH|nr:GNAT family N-acetyltransferase [Ancylobacter moscoviensis]TSJ64344.1 GNAT family N-acetyltransferase [Ancylobacter moscoviensis]